MGSCSSLTTHRSSKPLVWLLFGLALYLRTAGISNDWDAGNVYHPDTPKQMRAAERFVQGELYTRIGGRDYEGYPYFNSHLVALSLRAYTHATTTLWHHLGFMGAPPQPTTHDLFFITRLMNAILSSLTVLLAFLIGRTHIHRTVGWMAGLLLAFSPADITAAHYATGDVTAAFFAWCAAAVALSIARRPRVWAYPLAAVCAAAGFSAKYHGGIAVLAVGVAHLYAYAGWKPLFSRPSILRGLLFIGSFIVGILLTSPALLVNPEAAFKDILAFLEYTSSFGMTTEMAAAPLHQRFVMGMSFNMPVLLDIIGPVAALSAMAGILLSWRQRSTWVVAVVPLSYILAGLSTKPLTHPVYHTVATPGIFILAAAGIYGVSHLPRPRWAQASLALVLVGLSVSYLTIYSHREIFFYRHNDTRYMAAQWVQTHLPQSFTILTSAYTSPARIHDQPQPEPTGTALLYSPRVPIHPPAAALPMFHVALETNKLSVFRNWDQLLFVESPDHLHPPLKRPGFQPIPNTAPRTTLVDNMPWWVQRDLSWQATADTNTRGTLQTQEPIQDVFWLVRSGETPAEVRLSIGRSRRTIRLAPQAVERIRVQAPRATRLPRTPGHLYPWRIQGRFGEATVHLITDPREQFWALMHTGEFKKANALAQRETGILNSPGDQALADIAASFSQRQPDAPSPSPTPPLTLHQVHKAYGLSADFWEALPLGEPIEWDRTLQVGEDSHLQTQFLHLEPGHYTVTTRRTSESGPIHLRAITASRHELARWMIPTDADEATTSIVIDHRLGGLLITSLQDEGDPGKRPTVEIRPDPWRTVQEYQRIAYVLKGGYDEDTFSALAYVPFLKWGKQTLSSLNHDLAAKAFFAAIRAAPWRAEAYTQLQLLLDAHPELDLPDDIVAGLARYHATAELRTLHPVRVEMRNNMKLQGYRIAPRKPVAGQHIDLHLHWQTPRLSPRVQRHAAWIHIYQGQHDYDDRIHADQRLITFLSIPDHQDLMEPHALRIPLPEDLPAGTYRIETGLWIPSEHQRIRVRNTDLERSRRGVFLTTIEISQP